MIAIIPIDHGKSVLPENSIFQNGAEDKSTRFCSESICLSLKTDRCG